MMTAPIVLAAVGPLLAGLAMWETTAVSEPWWIAAIVVPLAGFSAWLVRWILQKQDDRDKLLLTREQAREVREDKRQEAFVQQVSALDSILSELRELNDHHKSMEHARLGAVKDIMDAIDELPDRIAKKR
jgi:hypothetical protein